MRGATVFMSELPGGAMIDYIVGSGPSFADLLRKYCSEHRSSTLQYATEDFVRASVGLLPLKKFPRWSHDN
jgi:hypothetical protein